MSRSPSADPRVTGFAYALGAYFAWGLLPFYFKALHGVPPLEVLAHRIVWSMVFLTALVALRGRLRELASALRAWRSLGVYAATTVLISVNWLTYIWSVGVGRILEASLGYFINPLVNVLLGVLFLHERLNRRQGWAVALAGVGVLALVLRVGTFPWISFVLALSFGLYGLVRKKARIDPMLGLLLETGLLGPVALAFLAHRAVEGTGALGSEPRVTVLLLLAGVITAVPLVWFTHGVQRLRYSTIGLIQYLAPTLQFLIAVLVYRERFTTSHAVAFGFIWVSLALYSWDALAQQRLARRSVPAPQPLPE